MQDYGCARCDFPGGSASQLFDSVQRLYKFPDDTKVFLNHDYLPPSRKSYACETTIKASKEGLVLNTLSDIRRECYDYS
jgi:glyoxylase-like metal-dependent hydrolase (beta-lactamase superfamily II)